MVRTLHSKCKQDSRSVKRIWTSLRVNELRLVMVRNTREQSKKSEGINKLRTCCLKTSPRHFSGIQVTMAGIPNNSQSLFPFPSGSDIAGSQSLFRLSSPLPSWIIATLSLALASLLYAFASQQKVTDGNGNEIPNGPSGLPLVGKALDQKCCLPIPLTTVIKVSFHSYPGIRSLYWIVGRRDLVICIQCGSAISFSSLFPTRLLLKTYWSQTVP